MKDKVFLYIVRLYKLQAVFTEQIVFFLLEEGGGR